MKRDRSIDAWSWRGLRWLVALLAIAAPVATPATFNCAQSVEYQSSWCASSQITSIPQVEASRACAEFSRALASTCRPDWDRFKSCDQFARRFEDLLLDAGLARKVPRKHCQSWSGAFAQGPLRRCERGRYTF